MKQAEFDRAYADLVCATKVARDMGLKTVTVSFETAAVLEVFVYYAEPLEMDEVSIFDPAPSPPSDPIASLLELAVASGGSFTMVNEDSE